MAASALRAGTSEMLGLPGRWATGITGVSPEETAAFRSDNPIAGIASQVVGALPTYIGGISLGARLAAKTLPRLYSAESAALRPFATSAGRAAAELVPLEAVRLGGAAAMSGDMEAVAASAGIDFAANVGLSLVGRFFRTLKTTPEGTQQNQLARMLPDYPLGQPPQLQIEYLTNLASAGKVPTEGRKILDDTLEYLRRQVRTEVPEQSIDATLEGFGRRESKELFSVFSRRTRKDIETRGLFTGAKWGFPDRASWEAMVQQVGLPRGWEAVTQFPRIVTAKTADEAKRLGRLFEKKLTLGPDGWRIGRFAGEDLFVLARRLDGSGPPDAGSRWFTAVTNRPEVLVPDLPMMRRSERLARFITGIENKALRTIAAKLPQDNVLRYAINLNDIIPWRTTVIKPGSKLSQFVSGLMPQAAKNVAKEYRPAMHKLWQETKNVAAPMMAQFNNAPMARQLLWKAGAVYRKGVERAQVALYGSVDLGKASPVGKLIRPGGAPSGVFKYHDALQEGDMAAFMRVAATIERGTGSYDDMLAVALKELDDPAQAQRLRDYLAALKKMHDDTLAHRNAVAAALGEDIVDPLPNRVLPHMWGGNFRWRLVDDKGTTQYMAWGRTIDEVRREADRIAKKLGLRKQDSGPFTATREEDLTEAFDLTRRQVRGQQEEVGGPFRPDILHKPRRGVGGYMFDPEGPTLTKKELWEIIESGIMQTEKAAADMAVKRLLVPKLADIESAYGRSTVNGVVQRINLLSGRQGDFSAWQNRMVEKIFPGWGKNGATKVAHALNQVETHFNLFFGNLMYLAQNTATVLHTVLPEVSLLRTLPMGQWSRVYDAVPLLAKGGVKGAAFIANPLKMVLEGARALRDPSAVEREIFRRAVRDRTIAPAFIEQEVGSKSRRVFNIKKIAEGEQSLWRTFVDMNELLPVKIEELTRAHALMIGTRIGQAVGLRDEALYQFAAQFTNRTMFGYAAADRPRLFTGPIGSMFGLFKNWMTHYLTNWHLYASEAFARGNFAPLLWAASGVAATGGIAALPFVTGLEAFRRWNDNKGLIESYYSAFSGAGEGGLADAVWFGLPALLGVSAKAQTAAPLNDPTRDLTFLANAAILDRVQRIWQLGGEAWEAWSVGGINPLRERRVWDRLLYGLSPRTTYKAFAQVQNGALRAISNGAPIYEGVTYGEYLMNSVGLTPVKLALAWEASRQFWEDRHRAAKTTASFGRQFAYAYLRDDTVAMTRILANAVMAGADISAVMMSVSRHLRHQLVPQLQRDIRSVQALERLEALNLQ